MKDAFLILNAGSSSLKFAVYSAEGPLGMLVRGQIEALAGSPRFRANDTHGRVVGEMDWSGGARLSHGEALRFLLEWGRWQGFDGRRVRGAGHRVVHGGMRFTCPVRLDAGVIRELERLVPLAPLHQPHNLAVIAAVSEAAPELPQVACFDTAFHSTQPALAQAFAIPREYSDAGVRRYGFHGLSYEYIAETLPGTDPVAAAGRTIVAHLGNGASMCAMLAGRSVATTMGFSAADGLVMGTRCGSIDPGVLLYLGRHGGLGMDQIEHVLYERSGLLGVSGISHDMRTLLASEDPRAREAVGLFLYRAAREIGSLAAALGGLDAIVFTGGIGQNAPAIRSGICGASRWLGADVDEEANTRHGPRISTGSARVAAWVIPTNEELMIARHTARVLGSEQGGAAGAAAGESAVPVRRR